MSAICQNFVQNAWKKELCSNCFKSKDEHSPKAKPKPSAVTPSKTFEGIIKTNKKSKTKRSVNFNKDLVNVIGFGGEDWSEEEEDVETSEETQEDDAETSSEEEKELQRLTKSNTDFNASSLNENPETKKSYAQLMLGKPQVDAEGRKQTLLVSVTPFGQDASKRGKVSSHIPIAKGKEAIGDNSKAVVLTSYLKSEDAGKEEKSLLDEISETLESGKNPIQIITRKKIQKEIILSVPKCVKPSSVPERRLTRNNPVIKREDKPVVFQTTVAKLELINTKNVKFSVRGKDKVSDESSNKVVETPSTSPDDTTSNSSLEESIKDDSSDVSDEKTEVIATKYENVTFPQSRELAGEPDGRADPEELNEPPALPLTPPPNFETHYEKPKVPSKPSTIAIRKPMSTIQNVETQNVLTTFISDDKPKLVKHDSNGSDIAKISNKRKAPKPPNEETPIYTRNSSITANSDSPIVRELEKRERASSCSPKVRDVVINSRPQGDDVKELVCAPEPAPRKSLSLSTDSLAFNEDKKKEKRGRFSLKKFLRMGSNRDLPKLPQEIARSEEEATPQPKPRLIIVHPLDLNNGKVEVLNKPHDQPDFAKADNYRASKPPPPPRNYDERPNLPHPPKSAEILNKHKNLPARPSPKKTDSVYANIGEVRSAIVPNKPQRTASMRECEVQQYQKCTTNQYEAKKRHPENVYEYINGRSSSPDYEKSTFKTPEGSTMMIQQRSESSIDVSSDYFKYGNMPRSMSLTYCGSETESEIYYPYSYYGSESEVAEDDHDWNNSGGRTHKLRSRKGRSIVHKNLEDNYGAVVIANHEALAQVLENIQQSAPIQLALRGLKNAPNLRWSDFSLKSGIPPLTVGSRAFHQAMWGGHHVTLVISSGSVLTSTPSFGALSLAPITEFSDLIPTKYIHMVDDAQEPKHLQATVAVLPCMQVNTIQSYGEQLKNKIAQSGEDAWKEVSFVLLQLVNALKTLQAQGIEELPLSLTSFVLCKEIDKEAHNRLCVLQGLGEDVTLNKEEDKVGTLCMCVLSALRHLQPNAKLAQLLQSLLNTERAVSLTQVKSVLEFSLWGPSDVALGTTVRERELALQRWLDLQRATVLHGLVCAKVHLTVYEECHLLFLVRSNPRMMCDASMLLESSVKQNVVTKGHK